jgi:hypothetical protein
MRATFEPFPSPLTGEGAGGGEDHTSSPHPHLPPPGGKENDASLANRVPNTIDLPLWRGKGAVLTAVSTFLPVL